jgi:hypothetical protein
MTKSESILIVLILIIPLRIIGQEDKDCSQFQLAFKHIENTFLKTEFKKDMKIQIDSTIQQWSGIPFMIPEYYAYQMDITKSEFERLDTTIRNEIYRENQKKLMKIDSTFNIDCFELNKYKRPNIQLSFTRISSEAISIWISKLGRNPKEHTSGKYLIFIFDSKNHIEKIFETTWIE